MDFEQLVASLLVADNDQRRQAEEAFDRCKENADLCTGSLVQVMRTSPNVEHRSFAAIMLRKVRESAAAAAALWPLEAGVEGGQ